MSALSADCGLNITHAAVDRHAGGVSANRAALRWPAANGNRIELTYADLQVESSRFAAVLTELEVKSGEVVAAYLGRVPALYVTALGAWRARWSQPLTSTG
jgi:acetyl-CoA synthetase